MNDRDPEPDGDGGTDADSRADPETDANADADADAGAETEADSDSGSGDEEPSVFYDVEVGEVDVTGGRTITEADVTNFAGVSGDFNHIHTDAERMEGSPFGGRIAHGMLVLSVATGLIWQHRSEVERGAVVAFYGIDDLRFRRPVHIGDTVDVRMEVLEKRERGEGPGNGTVRYGLEIRNQREEVVISCEMTSLLR